MNTLVKNKILILDDHRLFIDGLKLVLNAMPDIAQIDTAFSAQSLLDDVSVLSGYKLILADLQMPGLDGFDFLKAVSVRNLDLRIAILSGVQSMTDIEKAMQLGACGFVPKNVTASVLQHAVRCMLRGEIYLPEELAGRINLNLSSCAKLTSTGYHSKIGPRQIEVLELLKQGQTNKQIALVLNISESAIKSHVSILFHSLGVNTRTACVQAGVETGLIER